MMGYHHGPASFWMGRHRGRHKFRDFAAGWTTEGGFGGGRFRVGRKLGSEGFQLVVLALLAENPSHGYELIKVLEERSSGFYSPSPGMIYPALTYLEEVNYATVASEGAKKLYRITAEGPRLPRPKPLGCGHDSGRARAHRPADETRAARVRRLWSIRR